MAEKRARTVLNDQTAIAAAEADTADDKRQKDEDLEDDVDEEGLAAALEQEEQEKRAAVIPEASFNEDGDMVREPEPDFSLVDSPLMLRKIVKNLGGVLLNCVMEICDPKNDGTPNGDKPFVHVNAMDPEEIAVANMTYYPMELQKNVKGPCKFKIKLDLLKNCLQPKILPSDFEVYLRSFASTGDNQFVQAVFQKDAILRRRYLATQTIEDADTIQDVELAERWHVNVPVDIFKSEIKSALQTADEFPHMTFEMRRDTHSGHTYFGMRQEGTENDVWLSAPCLGASGSEFLEFRVESGGNTSSTKTQRDAYFRTKFRHMQPIFEGLTFQTAYLDRFVDGFVDGADQGDFVTLVFSPAVELEDGQVQNSPIVVKYNIGDVCRFRFTLMPVCDDGDE